MVKYRLKVHYKTEHTKKVSELMGKIMHDWGPNGKQLMICRVFEFETNEPLSQNVKDELVALKEDWMDKVELEEIIEVKDAKD